MTHGFDRYWEQLRDSSLSEAQRLRVLERLHRAVAERTDLIDHTLFAVPRWQSEAVSVVNPEWSPGTLVVLNLTDCDAADLPLVAEVEAELAVQRCIELRPSAELLQGLATGPLYEDADELKEALKALTPDALEEACFLILEAVPATTVNDAGVEDPVNATTLLGKLLLLHCALRGCLQISPRSALRIVAVSDRSAMGSLHGACSALLNTLLLENEHYAATSIQIDQIPWDAPVTAQRICSEIRSMVPSQFRSVRLESSGRYVRGYREWQPDVPTRVASQRPFSAGSVLLISGGLGALGRVFAERLLEQEGTRLVLCGRTPSSGLSDEVQAWLTHQPDRLRYLQADVTHPDQVAELIAETKRQFRRLDGILHMAGIIQDRLLAEKSLDSLRSVLRPKLLGAIYLDHYSRDEALSHFVLFSSIAAVGGAPGQCDYAAVNGYLDQFAESREALCRVGQRSGRSVSINWPLWREGGMHPAAPVVEQMVRRFGLAPLETLTGLRSFEAVVAGDQPQVMVATGDRDKIRTHYLGLVVPEPDKVPATDQPIAEFQQQMRVLMARAIKLDAAVIEADSHFSEYGFDSISLAAYGNLIMRAFPGISVRPTLFLEYPTLRMLCAHLHEKLLANRARPRSTRRSPAEPAKGHRQAREAPASALSGVEPIAVIGIGGRFPGARNIPEFWQGLVEGRCAVTPVPEHRWRWQEYYGDPAREPGKTDCYHAAFLERVDTFDCLHFNISPGEAGLMDPQHRLLLQSTWDTLEDAGYAKSALAGHRVGVYIGVEKQDYLQLMQRSGCPEEGYTNTGNTHSMMVNRLSHFFDWKGPSLALDTACSGSFSALNEAVRSLQHRETDLALAGGVNLLLTPDVFISGRQLGLLSVDGMVRPFDQDASGHLDAEGIGLVLLKRLSDAERDGDRIHGLIRGIALQHGGNSVYLTAPNLESHQQVIEDALRQADLRPQDIDCIEAQGAGDPLADSVELKSYQRVFAQVPDPIKISTLKGHYGHFGAASGVIALIKAILSLHNDRLIGVLNFEQLNWSPEDGEFPCQVVSQTTAWTARRGAAPRRIGVHNFGYGGVNGHLILEEFVDLAPHQETDHELIVPLSARTPEQLRTRALDLLAFIDSHVHRLHGTQELTLRELAYTLQVGREAMRERVAFLVKDLPQLRDRLQRFVDVDEDTEQWFRGSVAPGQARPGPADSTQRRELAQAWSTGTPVKWAETYAGNPPRRISLPVYPFAAERYWFTDGERSPVPSTAEPIAKAANATTTLHAGVLQRLSQLFCSITRLSADQLDPREPLRSYGIDSLVITRLNERLGARIDHLSKSLFFEFGTLEAVADYLVRSHPQDCHNWIKATPSPTASAEISKPARPSVSVPEAVPTHRVYDPVDCREPIAVIGMSGRFGSAESLADYWDLLKDGRSCVREIPSDRWPLDDFYLAEVEAAVAQGRSYSKWGSFLDSFAEFDPYFFNLSPREARNIDPQERLFLQSCWEAIEDAAYTRERIEGQHDRNVGVFAGITKTGFALHAATFAGSKTHFDPRTSFSSAANRVSYFLNLRGPSLAVDTMCSSSLVAIHEACEQLRQGRCELALAGGVNLYLHPSTYVELCAHRMLSQDGVCKSFGEGANGFVPGEGVGVLLLKPLRQAEADGDRIHAVLRGSSVNHGGQTHGYTVPNPNAQRELVREALQAAGVPARAVGYIEAHGTGTVLGDPIEITGLTQAFQATTEETGFCALGSVKSNIGHLEAAAGIAGLVKVILQMQHGQLVPSLHAETLNTNIAFEQTPFVVQQQLAPWPRPSLQLDGEARTYPRIAGVSSFGAGGVNAHLVVEEYRPAQTQPVEASLQATSPAQPIVLSAKTPDRLIARVRQLVAFLQCPSSPGLDLGSLAYTLQVGREAMEERLGLIVSSADELIQTLETFLRKPEDGDGIWRGRVSRDRAELESFVADEDLREAVQAWMRKGKYHQLLKMWVKGMTVDWHALAAKPRPALMGLPTYPFEREPLWLPESDRQAGSGVATVTQSTGVRLVDPAQLQPLAVTAGPPQQRRLEDIIESGSHPGERKVGGKPLQPGVVDLNLGAMMASAPSADLPVLLADEFEAIARQADARVVVLDIDCSGLRVAGGGSRFAQLDQAIAASELLVIARLSRDPPWLGWMLAAACDLFVCSDQATVDTADPAPDETDREMLVRRFGIGVTESLASLSGGVLQTSGSGVAVLPDTELVEWGGTLARSLATVPRPSLRLLKQHLRRTLPDRAAAVDSRRLHIDWRQFAGNGAAPADPGAAEPVNLNLSVVQLRTWKDGVLEIRLCDRESKNTFSDRLIRDLMAAFAHVGGATVYKVVVLTGFDHYFACGGTKDGVLSIQDGRSTYADSPLYELPILCPLPVIAAMQGHAIGAGWCLGLYCDLPLFSEESVYASRFMQFGFTPGFGSTLVFPEKMERDLAWEILFSAREYKGSELRARGLQLPVLPRAEVVPAALEMAHRIAARPRAEIVRAKERLAGPLRDRLPGMVQQELAMHQQTFVGNPEVLARIRSRYDEGATATATSVTRLQDDGDAGRDDPARASAIMDILRRTLAEELQMSPDRLDDELPFLEAGLDSITGVTWVRKLNERFGTAIAAIEVYNHPCLQAFCDFVLSQAPANPGHPSADEPTQPPMVADTGPGSVREPEPGTEADQPLPDAQPDTAIAVIGMSGQFPQARSLQAFWDNLAQGRDCIGEIPRDRWSIDQYYDPNANTPGKTHCRWMGALEDVDKFDPLFFNISPREAESMDPQQRLYLEAAWSCIEDAGIDPSRLSGERCGVFVGCCASDYRPFDDPEVMSAEGLMGGSVSILAARISYFLNLQGPCLTIDTACSSSLVAITSACDSLVSGASDLALAGGVCVMAGPAMHVMTSKAGMLSPDGRCFTFDQRANGFVPSEGVGVVLLKRLQDAQRDGDPIYGVFRGWGVNQDGKTNGITAPSGDSQTRLQRFVYDRYAIDPQQIQLIETHGTGTKLGDPIEIAALKNAFQHYTQKEHYCALGSVKSNIGHTLTAAGVAGVIKLLLAMQHRQLPPTIHCEAVNEQIALDGSPFYINTAARAWTVPEGARRLAAVSSFGFSGTNAHAVIEEYPQADRDDLDDLSVAVPRMVALSAKNEERLREVIHGLLRHLAKNSLGDRDLAALAYTLQVGRKAMQERLVVVSDSLEDLTRLLSSYLQGEPASERLIRGSAVRRQTGVMPPRERSRESLLDWIERADYLSLAKYWIQGGVIDWDLLYAGNPPRRLRLPTYPFARKRFWSPRGEAARARDGEALLCVAPVWERVRPQLSNPFTFEPSTLVIGATPEQQAAFTKQLPGARFIASAQQIAVELQRRPALDQMVWIAPEGPAVSLEDDRLLEAQERGLLDLFRATKTLLSEAYADRPLSLTVITTQDQMPAADAPLNPLHAGVHGLVGALAKECPGWQVRLLDLRSDAPWSWSELLRLPHDAQGEALVHRDGQWYRRKLVAVSSEPQSASYFKTRGVYVVIGGAGGLGQVWTRYVMQHYQARVVWIGRSAESDAIRAAIEQLAELGAAPLYIQADAADREALEGAYRQIKAYCDQINGGQINGVVHSAVGELDQSLSTMSEDRFRAILAAKVDVCLHMAQVFSREPLDLMLFFSSIGAFSKSGGFSGYAAGCNFADALARHLAQNSRTLVKVMNWGYWAVGVGDRVSEAMKIRQRQSGFGAIDAEEGMQALETLIQGPFEQLGCLKLRSTRRGDLVCDDETLTVYPQRATSCLGDAAAFEPDPLPSTLSDDYPVLHQEVEALVADLLRAILGSLSASPDLEAVAAPDGLAPDYARWWQATRSLLPERQSDATLDPESLWARWAESRVRWQRCPDLAARVELTETCLRALPRILTGALPAVDVIFPNSSLALVEGIYQGNGVSDLYNRLLADLLVKWCQRRRQRDPEVRLRILEIGAGTGGTTAGVLTSLQPFADAIDEYCYTDRSKSFLFHAEERFASAHPYLVTRLFDVEQPIEPQGILAGRYDVVIAANVLHATRELRTTLRNAKAALCSNGLLLLNEISDRSLFAHVTFGLLEGWWLHLDSEIRIPGSPGLYPQMWQRVLREEGFHHLCFPAAETHRLGQQVIAAESDGVVRQEKSSARQLAVANAPEPVPAKAPVSGPAELDVLSSEGQPAALPSGKALHRAARSFFKDVFGKLLHMEPEEIDAGEPLESYGIDSILIVQVTTALRDHFDHISSTLFFEVQTIDGLIDYLMTQQREALARCVVGPVTQRPESPASRTQEEPPQRVRSQPAATAASVADPQAIAIIGLSGRYPEAENLEAFWQNLAAGRDSVTEIPADRWSMEDFFHDDPEQAVSLGRSYSKWGGFLDGHTEFDPRFFNILPRDALTMDPQERLFLQACWTALEDAGYTREQLASRFAGNVGVFAGVTRADFNSHGSDLRQQGDSVGLRASFSSVANRVSYFMNLKGPSMPVDTMCSSSLVAVHEACEHLRLGACDMAFAGGVNLYLHPSSYVELCANRMLSVDGRCKSFGKGGNGFVPGEGVGVVLLKPLSRALEDRDDIYAVIRATAINHGGRTNGFSVPNPNAQAAVIRDSLDKAGVDARAVSYLEAHGTGTELGDPIEVDALTRAFRQDTGDLGFCSLGSLKSNLGHLEAAAGIAGLTKVILQMRHARIAPSLHCQQINPEIDLAKTPFTVPQSLGEWRRPRLDIDGQSRELPRIAGISSFGAGGTNAHVILEECRVDTEAPTAPSSYGPAVILLSAGDESRLRIAASNLLAFTEESREPPARDLQDIAYTLQVGREAMVERLSLVVESLAELRQKLTDWLSLEKGGASPAEALYRGRVTQSKEALTDAEADPALAQSISDWIRDRNFAALAECWSEGLSIDWEWLHRGRSPRRIHMPTYVFARERYWIEVTPQSQPAVRPGVGLHPRVDANQPAGGEREFSSRLSGEEAYFAGHRVDDKPLLPAVAVLEMARSAFCLARGEAADTVTPLRFSGLCWAEPVTASSAGVDVHIGLLPNDDGTMAFELATEQRAGGIRIAWGEGALEKERVVHCQGTLSVLEDVVTETVDLAAVESQLASGALDPAEGYAAFTAAGIHYGPSMRALDRLYLGEGQILARLIEPVTGVSAGDSLQLPPSLLDGALQAAIALVIRETGWPLLETSLPVAIDELRVTGSCAGTMWALLREVSNADSDPGLYRFDVDLCDELGEIRVSMRGVTYLVDVEPMAGYRAAQQGATVVVSPGALQTPAKTPQPVSGQPPRIALAEPNTAGFSAKGVCVEHRQRPNRRVLQSVDVLADLKSAMPDVVPGAIPTLNRTGVMAESLLACSVAFVDYASRCKGEVLDLGCAYGVATLPALAAGARVLAVDMEQRHLDILNERIDETARSRLETRRGVVPDIDFQPGRFAAIHASRVLHFLKPEAVQTTLRKMFDWLKPGGKLFVVTDTPYVGYWASKAPDYESRKASGEPWPGFIEDVSQHFDPQATTGAPNLINPMDPDILQRECEAAGFEVEESRFFDAPSLGHEADSPKTELPCALAGIIAVKPLNGRLFPVNDAQDFRTHRIASFDGVSLAATLQGSGQPALLFVHGGLCDQGFWDAQVAHFTPRHRVITLDLAGHGRSGDDREEWTMAAYGADIASVVRHAEVDTVILIGHGMGARAIAEAAIRIPQRIAGLVAVDLFDLEVEPLSEHSRQALLASMKSDFGAAIRRSVDEMLPVGCDDALRQRIVEVMTSMRPEVALDSLDHYYAHTLPEGFARFLPSLVLINAADLEPTNVEAATASGVTLKLIDNAGHFSMLTRPQLFNRALEEAITSLAEKDHSIGRTESS